MGLGVAIGGGVFKVGAGVGSNGGNGLKVGAGVGSNVFKVGAGVGDFVVSIHSSQPKRLQDSLVYDPKVQLLPFPARQLESGQHRTTGHLTSVAPQHVPSSFGDQQECRSVLVPPQLLSGQQSSVSSNCFANVGAERANTEKIKAVVERRMILMFVCDWFVSLFELCRDCFCELKFVSASDFRIWVAVGARVRRTP